MANLEDTLSTLRERAQWFELRPHWGAGGAAEGWAITLRSFNTLFEVDALIIRDTVIECAEEALRRLGDVPVNAVQPRKPAQSTKKAASPAAAVSAPPRRLLKKK